jgi:hypothetical protein
MVIRRWMIVAAFVAGSLATLRLAAIALGRHKGPHESHVTLGQRAVIFSEGAAEITTYQNDGRYRGPKYQVPAATTIPGGTWCMILADSQFEDDDCDPSRPIAIKVVEGPRQGAVLYVARKYLRPR